MQEKKSFIDKYAGIIVVFCMVGGSLSGTLGKLITAPSVAITFWRLTFALPVFLIPVLAKRSERKEMFGYSGQSWVLAAIAGVCLFSHFFCWFNAAKNTAINSAQVILSLQPLVTLAITLFIYKRKVPDKAIAAIFVALAGIVAMILFDASGTASGSLKGDIYAAFAGVFMAVYFSIGEKVRKEAKGNIYVVMVFSFCWLSALAAMLATKTPFIAYSLRDFGYIFLMSMICQVGSHALLNMCIGHVPSLYVSTWKTFEMVASTLIALALLKQVPTVANILCSVVVIAALLAYNKFESKKI